MTDTGECIDLSTFSRHQFERGRGFAIRCLWIALAPLIGVRFLPSRCRVGLLKLFGAQIGSAVRIGAQVQVRYPWRLRVGKNCWIGEDCWIDNWAQVTIGNSVCLSQSTYLCTGNHDWSDPSFAIAPKGITIANGAWVAARAVIGPGVEIGTGSIAAIGSVVVRSVPAWEIHAGNPATLQRVRHMRTSETATSVDEVTSALRS